MISFMEGPMQHTQLLQIIWCLGLTNIFRQKEKMRMWNLSLLRNIIRGFIKRQDAIIKNGSESWKRTT